MIDCFQKLKTQQETEIAIRSERINSKEIENAKLSKDIELGKARTQELTKESEAAMKRLEDRILEPER